MFWPLFSEKISKIFWNHPSRQVHDTDIRRWKRSTRHPLYSGFFGKRSVKNRLFPKKNEKKSRTASSPWRTLPHLIFKIFRQTISKKPNFSEKNRDFSAFAHELSIGVTARQIENWPLFSEKIQKFFGFVHPGRCATPSSTDDRAAIPHPLYSGFFGKRSEKNGLFLKKVLIAPTCRPVHTQKITKRSTLFLKKTFHTVYSKNFGKWSIFFPFFAQKPPLR